MPNVPINRSRSRNQTRFLIFAAVAPVAWLLHWEGNIAHYLFGDEGFLWYGVQRVMQGEIPIRDFMAYDPGRYYWAAAIASLLGDDSIIATRVASAIFQTIGLFIGLWLITPANMRTNAFHILLSAIVLSLWMYPNYKIYDATVSILLIAAFAYLADHPTYQRLFLAGLVLGLAACLGKNHGVYGAVGGIFLLTYLKTTQRDWLFFKAAATWTAGIFIGYLPMLFMLISVPGFGIAFWEKSVRILFEYKRTNVGLPIPWPWLVDFHQRWFDVTRDVFVGLGFILVLLYSGIGIVLLVRSVLCAERLPASFVASVVLALPYAHYVFSRADVTHLALGIFPLLIGLLGLLMQSSTAVKGFGTLSVFIMTILTILPSHSGWMAQAVGNWPVIKIAGSVLVVDPTTAGVMKSINELIEQYAPNGQDFITAPFWPGAYAAFGRKSPMWEIYALFPQSEEFQRAEIERIKNTNLGFILINDHALDGDEENRFSKTHPIIDQFIRANYALVDTGVPNTPFRIYVPKANVHSRRIEIVRPADVTETHQAKLNDRY